MITNFIKLLIIFQISQHVLAADSEKDYGQHCIIKSNGKSGVCRLINECDAKLNGTDIEKTPCKINGPDQVVCCPKNRSTRQVQITPTRVHEEKCKEYLSAVYEQMSFKPLVLGASNIYTKVEKCGHKVIPLIVKGELAKPKEFPHMALIGFDNPDGTVNWGCGGALISPEYVLTAGHCLRTRRNGNAKYVRLGELNIDVSDEDAKPEDFGVEEIIAHPFYKVTTKYHDIGLIKLDRIVDLSPYIRPACLPSGEVPDDRFIATGWGRTLFEGESSSSLQKVVLDKFSYKECGEVHQPEMSNELLEGINVDQQLCAGSRNDTRDTCQGDSGGPLQIYHKFHFCMYTIVGVTSFGQACGTPGIPGVYTKVSSYVDWIESVVWEENSYEAN